MVSVSGFYSKYVLVSTEISSSSSGVLDELGGGVLDELGGGVVSKIVRVKVFDFSTKLMYSTC